MNREFLMLAKDYDPNKVSLSTMWGISEKLDGQRAYWDGGLTRGLSVYKVPFANQNRDARDHQCTGLWSRYGKPIFAPGWWLDRLPLRPLDGELYIPLSQGNRQDLSSIVKTLIPGPGWRDVEYWVFDTPGDSAVFCEGRINNPNFKAWFDSGLLKWVKERRTTLGQPFFNNHWFDEGLCLIKNALEENGNKWSKGGVILVHQEPWSPESQESMMKEVQAKGGEGLMLRKLSSYW
jgi:hypothetical protein